MTHVSARFGLSTLAGLKSIRCVLGNILIAFYASQKAVSVAPLSLVQEHQPQTTDTNVWQIRSKLRQGNT